MEPLSWSMTAWTVNDGGGWKLQPVITIEGQSPFYADHPDDYIRKLQEMHDNPQIARSGFYTIIGQLQDALEQHWIKENGETSARTTNGVSLWKPLQGR